MKNLKNKQTIHVIAKYFYPVTGGIELNLFEVYSNLPKGKWSVTVHTSKDTLTKRNVLPNDEEINGIKIERYQYHWYGFIPKFNWNKTEIISLHNFYVFPHCLIFLYCLLLKLTRMKKFIFILTPHSGFNPDWKAFPKFQAIVKAIYHYAIGTLLINNTVDGIRAISEWEKQEMIKKGINQSLIKVIKNGTQNLAFEDVDKLVSRKFKNSVNKANPYIIQVGRINPIKNYETAIKALSKLRKDIKFIVVGPDQDLIYKKHLLRIIKTLHLKERVIFLGKVTEIEKYYLMRQAQAMVHMAYHEGYCNAVNEGMSQGLVCIVSNRTALPFLVKDGLNGYCLGPDDFEAVAEKINFVLKNKKFPKILEMEKRNRDFTVGHSWQNVAQEVEDYYSERIAIAFNQ